MIVCSRTKVIKCNCAQKKTITLNFFSPQWHWKRIFKGVASSSTYAKMKWLFILISCMLFQFCSEYEKMLNFQTSSYNRWMTSFRVIDQSKTNSTFRINWRKKEKSTCISSHFWKMVVLVYKMSFRKGSRYVNHSLWAIYCGTRPIEREMIPFLLFGKIQKGWILPGR